MRLLQQTTSVPAIQRGRQESHAIKIHSVVDEFSEQLPMSVVQEQCQPILINEDCLPNLERQVIIDEHFYKGPVSNRLGPNSRTYSDVVRQKDEYVRQPKDNKRIHSEELGPHRRTNSSHIAVSNIKESHNSVTTSGAPECA